MRRILFFIVVVLLMSGCGSSKRTVTATAQETVSEKIDTETKISIDTSKVVSVIDVNLNEIATEKKVTETTYETIRNEAGEVVAVVPAKKTETIKKSVVKDSFTTETSIIDKGTTSIEHSDKSEIDSRIDRSYDEEEEKKESQRPKYLFWSLVLIAFIGALIFFQKEFKIFKFLKRKR